MKPHTAVYTRYNQEKRTQKNGTRKEGSTPSIYPSTSDPLGIKKVVVLFNHPISYIIHIRLICNHCLVSNYD